MAISQPLMALMSMDVRPPDSGAMAANAQHTEAGGDFAQLLAAQMPEELQPAISQLTAEQLTLLEQATLAADGKSLPSAQDWLSPDRSAKSSCMSSPGRSLRCQAPALVSTGWPIALL